MKLTLDLNSFKSQNAKLTDLKESFLNKENAIPKRGLDEKF